MDIVESVTHARSLLAVPGHRPDRFAKAARSGADAIMVDLEDAVGSELKVAARENVHKFLSSGASCAVRINAASSPWYAEDVEMLQGRRSVVILPKVTSRGQIECLLSQLTEGSCVVPLLETAVGILNAHDVCKAPGTPRAIFGNVDLASELGISHTNKTALALARSLVVLASAAGGLAQPIDGLTTSIYDNEQLAADLKHAATLGFTGKLCLHPKQIPFARDAFSPSVAEIQWAQDVLAAIDNGSVTVLKDQVIGKPVVDRAKRLLSRSESQT